MTVRLLVVHSGEGDRTSRSQEWKLIDCDGLYVAFNVLAPIAGQAWLGSTYISAQVRCGYLSSRNSPRIHWHDATRTMGRGDVTKPRSHGTVV